MIIFGSGRKVISGSMRAVPQPCPSCGQMAMGQTVIQRYFHLFFIPTLPMGKDCVAHCGHCGRSMAMPVPPTASTPIWSFAGAGILAVIFGISIVSSAMQKASTRTADAAPQVNNAVGAPAAPAPPPPTTPTPARPTAKHKTH